MAEQLSRKKLTTDLNRIRNMIGTANDVEFARELVKVATDSNDRFEDIFEESLNLILDIDVLSLSKDDSSDIGSFLLNASSESGIKQLEIIFDVFNSQLIFHKNPELAMFGIENELTKSNVEGPDIFIRKISSIASDMKKKFKSEGGKADSKKSGLNEGSSKQEQTKKRKLDLWLKEQSDIAWKLYEKEEYKKAIEISEPAIEKAKNNKFHKIQGDLLDVWVRTQIKLLNYSEAEDGIERMLSLGDINNLNVLKAKALYDRALIQKRQNDLKSAIETNKVAIGLFKKEEDSELYTSIKLWLSGEGVPEFMSVQKKKDERESANKTINEIEKLAKDKRDSRAVKEKNKLDVSLFLIENDISEDKLEEALNVIIDLPNRVDTSGSEDEIANLYKTIINEAISKNQINLASKAGDQFVDFAVTKKQRLAPSAIFHQAKVAQANGNIEGSTNLITTVINDFEEVAGAPFITEIYKWLMDVKFSDEELISKVKNELTEVLSGKLRKQKVKVNPLPGTSPTIDADIEISWDTDQAAKKDLGLGYKEYTNAFVSFIDGGDDVDQLVIGLHGEWGRGKSTLMYHLKKMLAEKGHTTVELNAWKYKSEENIWAAFIHALLSQVPKKVNIILRPYYRFSLFRHKVIVSILIISTILSIAYSAYLLSIKFEFDYDSLSNPNWKGLLATAVIGVSLIIRGLIKSYKIAKNLGLKWLEVFKKIDYSESLGAIGKIDDDLYTLTKLFSRVKADQKPIVIFIDDLDRCPPNRIVEVINAINTLTLSKGFIFFLGYDRKYVASAICAEYKEMIGIYDEQNRDKLQFGYEFLDKIIQIPFRIPVGSSQEIHKFVMERLKLSQKQYFEPRDIVTIKPAELFHESNKGLSIFQQEGETLEVPETNIKTSDADAITPKVEISNDKLNEISGIILKSAVNSYRLTNPRKIKKFINTFKLMSYIAQEQRKLMGEIFTLQQLGFLMFFEANYSAELISILDENKNVDYTGQNNTDEINNAQLNDMNIVQVNEEIKKKMAEDLLLQFNVERIEDLKQKTSHIMNFISGSLT